MSIHDGAKTNSSCLHIAGRSVASLFGKLMGARSQVIDAGKAWVNKLLKHKREEDQDDDDDDDDDFQAPDPLKRFAPVLKNINTAVIQEYASCIRRARMPSQQYEVTPWLFVCTTDREPFHGSSNILIPLCFGDGVRWLFKVPYNGYDTSWNDMASRSLTSEVSTMWLLRHNGLPVPEVYSFEASIDNALGCPFILMEHMGGRPAHEGWYDNTLSNEAKEQFRQRCLQTLALAMRKLSTLRFAQGGALDYNIDGNVCSLQPIRVPDLQRISENILEWKLGNKEADDREYFLELGPFDSDEGERDYLMALLDQQPPAEGKLGQGIYQLLRLFMEWMPQDNTRGSFVIAHPDLDLQNVLVDESGTVTGLIDWDGVATVSQLAGCTYPNWLTDDWDPWSYEYRSGQSNVVRGREIPSPRELNRYRKLYTGFLEQIPGEDGDNTLNLQYIDTVRKSLLMKSLKLAIENPHGTDNIVIKIFKLIAQISGQDEFRPDDRFLSQTDDSSKLSSFGSGRVLADAANPEEEHSSSATLNDTYQSAEADGSRHSQESTPPAEMSSTSSIESNNASMDSAMDGVIGPARPVEDQSITRVNSDLAKNSKKGHLCSGLRKFARTLSSLNKHGDSRLGQKEIASEQSILVDDTMFEIVKPQHMASNAQREYKPSIGQIQQPVTDSIGAQGASLKKALVETNSPRSSEEASSSTALSTNVPSRDLQGSTDDSSPAARIIDTTGARPRYLSRPSKSAQEISHVVGIQAKAEVPDKDIEVPPTAHSKDTGSHDTTKSTLSTEEPPRRRRHLVKKQTIPPKSSTNSTSNSSSSSSKSQTKRLTSWLKSVVHKNSLKKSKSALSISQLPDPHSSEIGASATTEAPESSDMSVQQDPSATSSPSTKKSHESTMPALEPIEPSNPQSPQDAPGPQKFDLDNLKLIDGDQLWDEGFLPIQVCHDLVDGKLDEARMRRLRTGFEVLLNSL